MYSEVYSCVPNMKILGQGFQTLDSEQDRHTHRRTQRRTRANALPAAFTGRVVINCLKSLLPITANYRQLFVSLSTTVTRTALARFQGRRHGFEGGGTISRAERAKKILDPLLLHTWGT